MSLEISVVVPTHNRPERLGRLLAALRAQDLGPDRFEVIVVDDGACPRTAELLERERGAGALQLITGHTEGSQGPARARNVGWRIARAPLIAFTDDDCVPLPGWLGAGLARAGDCPGAIVQGPTEPDPAERDEASPFSRTLRQAGLGPQYETCNMFYPRDLLERLDGFDERFDAESAGEDTELAWRALRAGAGAVLAPEARVLHAVDRVGARATLRSARRWTSCVRVVAQYPETRTMLHRRVFWNVWHYLLLRSVLSLLAPRWLRRLVLIRYLWVLRARAVVSGAGVRAVPFLVLYDALETVAIAKGAIRYRTLIV